MKIQNYKAGREELIQELAEQVKDIYTNNPIKNISHDEKIETAIVDTTIRLIRKYGNPNNIYVKWLLDQI